jgi:hypothetical protein
MNPSSQTTPSVSGSAPNTNATTPAPPTTTEPIKVVRGPSGATVPLGEIGRSGTFIYSGIITGEEYNLELTRFEGVRKYEIMRRSDSTIAAMLQAVKLPVEATNWHITPASEEPQDVEAADLCRQELFERNIDFSEVLQNALLMIEFGYSANEIVLEYADFNPSKGTPRRIIGLKKLAFRKHRSIYKWETFDHQPGITQYVPGGTYSVPMEKLCVFTFNKEGDNWEGIPLLRRVYKDWDIKDKLVLINAIRHERQGLGIIQVTAPDGASPEDIAKVVDNARMARASEEAVFQNTEGYVVEFMDMHSGAGQLTNIIETIEYHDKQIMLSVLAQFVMLGQSSTGGGGSKALSQDGSSLFILGLESVAKVIRNALQRQVVQKLCDANFTNLNGRYPKLDFDGLGDDNLVQTSEAVGKLVTAGALTMDPDLEERLRKLLKMPELPDDIRKDYANRKTISGGAADLQAQLDQANAAAAANPPGIPANAGKPGIPGKKPPVGDGKDKGNTEITGAEDPLAILKRTKELAMELLAHEYAAN